jgi:hypothetical protein
MHGGSGLDLQVPSPASRLGATFPRNSWNDFVENECLRVKPTAFAPNGTRAVKWKGRYY